MSTKRSEQPDRWPDSKRAGGERVRIETARIAVFSVPQIDAVFTDRLRRASEDMALGPPRWGHSLGNKKTAIPVTLLWAGGGRTF